MGLSTSTNIADGWENPAEKYDATLYYFSGRGMADQIRWMMAATDVNFTQKVISHKDQLAKMARQQLPFGQLPLLQIDGIEIVQSQAAVRYLARRGGLEGKTPDEVLKCDMIAETVRDLLSFVTSAPFKRAAGLTWDKIHNTHVNEAQVTPSESSEQYQAQESSSTKVKPDVKAALSKQELENPDWIAHQTAMKDKWHFIGGRFEAILRSNLRKQHPERHIDKEIPAVYLVGDSITYADVLVAHITTWFVEECGSDIMKEMPLLVNLQHAVISLPGIRTFLKSINYFPVGNVAYVDQVS